jgi:hypothetical protein
LNICLLIASLIGYLEWGGGNSAFLFQAEYDLLFNSGNKDSFAHPFVLIPLIGQLLLLFTVFQKEPSKVLTYIAMSCLGLLLVFMLFIGIMGMNWKMILCALPFVITSILILRNNRKRKLVTA